MVIPERCVLVGVDPPWTLRLPVKALPGRTLWWLSIQYPQVVYVGDSQKY